MAEEENTADQEKQEEASSLRKRSAKGTVWVVLSFGGAQILRLIGNLIVTRLLFEEAFGVMALINVFLQGLVLFSDIGIGPSIIQNERGEERSFLDTAFTIQIGRGFFLFLVTCAAAIPFSRFYDEPLLVTLLPIAGLVLVFGGFQSTKYFSMNRNLRVGLIATIEITSQFIAIVVMIVWALIDRSVWALLAGSVVGPFLRMAMTHIVLPGRWNRPHWNRKDAVELIRFGKWIFASTALTFLANQSDRLIFGKIIPLGMLGVYHIGATLAFIPAEAFENLMSKVIFPMFSRVREMKGDLPGVFRRVRWTILSVSGWVVSGLTAGGVVIIEILYDERYAQAGWMLQFLSSGVWFAVISATYKAVLLAQGKANLVAACNLSKLIGMAVFIPIGYMVGEFPGAVAGLVLSDVFRAIVSIVVAARQKVRGLLQDATMTGMVLVAGVAGYGADQLVSHIDGHIALRVLAVFVAVTLVWSPFAVRFVRQIKRDGSPFK